MNSRSGLVGWTDYETYTIMAQAVAEGEKNRGIWRVVEMIPVWENAAAIEITGGEA